MTVVVDSSALLAIVFKEPERKAYFDALADAERAVLSYVSLHEARIVLLRRLGEPGIAQLDDLIAAVAVELVVFDGPQAEFAIRAYSSFGKGRHPARLNLADCAAYALAKSLDAPLLFKGDDFRQTDVTPAI